jgi:DNA-binding transcriptional ArsR family regulator
MYHTHDVEGLIEQTREASELLKAMANETRLQILCLLSKGERSVTELEKMMHLPQPTVSQQLARLRSDNLVRTRRDGRTIYYSLADGDAVSLIESLYDVFVRRGNESAYSIAAE